MSSRLNVKEQNKDFIDYERLKKEVKSLERERNKLIAAVNAERQRLSDTVEDGIKIKKESDLVVSKSKEEAKKILAKATDKQKNIIQLESVIKGKIGNAEASKVKLDNLIKSNEGKEKNLEKTKKTLAEKIEKLVEIYNLVKNVI